MRIVKDLQEREWELVITVGTVKRVRSKTGLDIYKIEGGDFIDTIVNDPEKFCDMFWAILEKQAIEKGVSELEFAEGFGGEVIEDLTNAFLEELTDFFHPSKRAPMKAALAKTQKLVEMAGKRVEAEIQGMDLEKEVDTVMEHMKQISKT